MTEYTMPYFGKLPIENLEDYYDVNIDYDGSEIQIDLNFENETIEISALDKTRNFIENIGNHDKQNRKYILNDYNDKDGDTVKTYLQHHLEAADKEELSRIINFEDTKIKQEQQLLAKLKLIRVGLYPEDEENFAVFDYSIGQDITDYLVVINTDPDGKLDYMAMES